MDFDAESSSTEAAAAFTTVSEASAAVGVPQNVADKSAARDEEEADKEEELHNVASLKSNVSNVTISNFGTIIARGVLFRLILNSPFLHLISITYQN